MLDQNIISEKLNIEAKEKIARLEIFQSISSTNSYLISNKFQSGSVCLAETQTAGRGRMGKQWISPPGANIYLSLLWQFSRDLSGISLVVGLAVIQALEKIQPLPPELGLKWPNDIWYKGLKLSGILLEAVGNAVVIGVGLNVNMPPEIKDAPWVDLRQIWGKTICRNILVGAILNELVEILGQFEQSGFSAFKGKWQKYDLLAGKNVILTTPMSQKTGVAKGISDKGELLVQIGDHIDAITYGEVSVRPDCAQS